MLNIVCPSRYKINRKELRKIVTDFFLKNNLSESYLVNLIFIGRNKMRKISHEYKKEDVALPVLSFKYNQKTDENEYLLGEVYLCYPQIILLAAERNKKVSEMIKFLVNHGLENLLI